jgi:hypothetical protein
MSTNIGMPAEVFPSNALGATQSHAGCHGQLVALLRRQHLVIVSAACIEVVTAVTVKNNDDVAVS